MELKFLSGLKNPAETKIVLLILDGLGGLPREPGGKTELETAHTPNLDRLAGHSSLGLTQPVGPGITTGSGPGHLAIFGYDPIQYQIGRGAMEALGADFDLRPDDVAARGNFCSVDTEGALTDRRAGRLPSEQSLELIQLLRTIRTEDVRFFVEPVKEHRFVFVMRGKGLADALTETDPLMTGVTDLPVRALNPKSEKAAQYANGYVAQARKLLADQWPANSILLRGFASLPNVPQYADLFGLKAGAIAIHGMYRGVARMVGMTVLDVAGETIADELTTLEKYWHEYDFFYLHVKKTDTCGENGDFDGKVAAIEEVDAQIPRLMALNPDVFIVSGDHSSPAVLKFHSWHPVPLLLYSRFVRPDGLFEFGEHSCQKGSLGIIPATHALPLALANAGRLAKYGA
jgi:2,3-bisphosphoglycerate-independent phosphoglycerate mutase